MIKKARLLPKGPGFLYSWTHGMHPAGGVLLAMLTIVMMFVLSLASGRLPIWW